MLILNDKIRVRVIDKNNYTFEKYKEVESKTTKEISFKWVQVGGYYGTLDRCLKALKNYLVNEELDKNEYNIEDLISYIDKLNGSFVDCEIRVLENE